jgi:DNA-binding transcriptional ArsR family regulator
MVRSATPRSERPAGPRPAPVVRDFRSTSASYRIEWDVRPVYDFVFSLSDEAGGTDDLPAGDRRWLTEARAALPEVAQADRDGLLASEMCIHIAELIVARPDISEPAEFVAAAAALDRRTAVQYLLGDLSRDADNAALLDRAIDGDAGAVAAIGEQLPEYKRDHHLALIRDPEGVLRRLVGVLDAWQRPFREVEPRVMAMLHRDVEARADDARTLAPGELIEKTTGGLRFMPEPGIARVILAPSYFARPYNFLFSNDDWRLYGYPIADSALDSADPFEPPPAVVRLHRALGDPSRLRILRLLADGDRYLTEIAQALELSKPTVKHHMAQLRAAGLVTLTEEGSLTYYSLRRDRLDEIGTDLRRFVTT